jgi:hypothetical protein
MHMDETLFWLISIIGPAILLILLVWLVVRNRNNRAGTESQDITERGTDAVYSDEERRRREGTDGL